MPDNVAASMTASIVLDKSDLLAQILKGLSEGQKELQNNKLEMYFDFSNSKNQAEFEKVIQKYRKQLSSQEFVVQIKDQGIDETVKSLDKLIEVVKSLASGKAFGTGLGNGKGIGNSIVDEKQLKTVINLFEKMESHLGSMRKVISDVGDGDEFSPLLTMINKVDSSISELAKKTSSLSLNMNLDFGSDDKMTAEVQSRTAKLLHTYENLFNRLKMSGTLDSNMQGYFDNFDINQYDNMNAKIAAYKNFITEMREMSKQQFGKDYLYSDIEKSYYSAVSGAQRSLNNIIKSENTSNNSIENLFGKTDLSEVISQLTIIVNKLDEISKSANNFTNVFKNGLDVNTSIQEVIDLTNRVKELETELAKIKNVTPASETNISSGLDSNISKYQEIVSLVKEYYELSQKIQTPKLSYQKRSEDYDRIDGYLLKKAPQKVGTTDIEKDINDRYHKMAKGVNEGSEFAIKAMRSAIQRYWSDVTEMPSDEKLLSSRKVIPYGNKGQKEEYIIPKKYQDMEKSVIQETIAMNKNNIAYEEERKQIEANNSALKERMDLIRNTIKSYDKNPDYNGEYKMGLSLKSSDKGKTDIFSSVSSMSQEEMLQEICNMLGVEIPKNANKAKEAIKEVASATATTEPKKDAFPDKDVSASVESATNSIKEENNVLEQNTQKVKENTQAKEQNANANLNKYDKRLDSYNGKVDKYQATIDRFNDGGWTSDAYLKNVQAVRDAVKQYATLLDNIKTNQNGIATDEDIQNLDKYEKKIKDTIATVTNMSASEKGYNFVSGQKELDKIHKLLNENSKMSSEAKAKIKAYYREIESGNPTMSLDKIHAEIMKIYNAEIEAGRAGRSLKDIFQTSRLHQMVAQVAGMFSFYDLINLGRQFASTVTDINTQITGLAKVSEQSSKQIYADFDSYADIAKEVRGTISDTIAATADWSKNGYSIPDAKQLAEVSQLYKNVGDGIDIDAANESLISTLKGFQLEADQAEHIVDVFNEVSNNEAISSGGIGEALQRSAASFNAASTSLEKSVSLVTATNSVLQDPEKVGNMWRTVSARLRGSETELKEMGEDTDGLVTSTSKLQALVKGITGFDIMKDKDTYKDIYDIVLGIGEKWQDLSDIDRASLLEALAGKQQSNALAAALSNIDILKKSYEEATNAEGSARKENEEYSKSIQASIDLTKAKLEELSNDLLSSNFLKGAIDAGGKLLELLDFIISDGREIPAIFTTIGAVIGAKKLSYASI